MPPKCLRLLNMNVCLECNLKVPVFLAMLGRFVLETKATDWNNDYSVHLGLRPYTRRLKDLLVYLCTPHRLKYSHFMVYVLLAVSKGYSHVLQPLLDFGIGPLPTISIIIEQSENQYSLQALSCIPP